MLSMRFSRTSYTFLYRYSIIRYILVRTGTYKNLYELTERGTVRVPGTSMLACCSAAENRGAKSVFFPIKNPNPFWRHNSYSLGALRFHSLMVVSTASNTVLDAAS